MCKATQEFLLESSRHAIPCCSVISAAEIYAGMRPAESASTAARLDAMVVIPVTRQIAEQAGYFKARTRARRLELADCLSATSCSRSRTGPDSNSESSTAGWLPIRLSWRDWDRG
jgi:predicted nucleic acid-binding protein